MKDNKKLAKTIAYLLETYKDSREYMDGFYDDCKHGEVEDLEWLVSDDEMSDFINACPVEYNRIYDYALLELSRRLLNELNEK